MNDMVDKVARAIEDKFLESGKWELDVVPEGHPTCSPGRWLDCSDANYSFRPIDLAQTVINAMKPRLGYVAEHGSRDRPARPI